jgi:hypothetical protein
LTGQVAAPPTVADGVSATSGIARLAPPLTVAARVSATPGIARLVLEFLARSDSERSYSREHHGHSGQGERTTGSVKPERDEHERGYQHQLEHGRHDDADDRPEHLEDLTSCADDGSAREDHAHDARNGAYDNPERFAHDTPPARPGCPVASSAELAWGGTVVFGMSVVLFRGSSNFDHEAPARADAAQDAHPQHLRQAVMI